eukprot:g78116.t1
MIAKRKMKTRNHREEHCAEEYWREKNKCMTSAGVVKRTTESSHHMDIMLLFLITIAFSSILLLLVGYQSFLSRRWARSHEGEALDPDALYTTKRLVGCLCCIILAAVLATVLGRLQMSSAPNSSSEPAPGLLALVFCFQAAMNGLRCLFLDLIGNFVLRVVQAILSGHFLQTNLVRYLTVCHYLLMWGFGAAFLFLTIATVVWQQAVFPDLASAISLAYIGGCALAMWVIHYHLNRVVAPSPRMRKHLRRFRIFRNIITLAVILNVAIRIKRSLLLSGQGHLSFWQTWDAGSDMQSLLIGNVALLGFVYMSHLFQKDALESKAQNVTRHVETSGPQLLQEAPPAENSAPSALAEANFLNVVDGTSVEKTEQMSVSIYDQCQSEMGSLVERSRYFIAEQDNRCGVEARSGTGLLPQLSVGSAPSLAPGDTSRSNGSELQVAPGGSKSTSVLFSAECSSWLPTSRTAATPLQVESKTSFTDLIKGSNGPSFTDMESAPESNIDSSQRSST